MNSISRSALVARQVLIWGLPVDPIIADGAGKLRSRAAPSARVEPEIWFLTEQPPTVQFIEFVGKLGASALG